MKLVSPSIEYKESYIEAILEGFSLSSVKPFSKEDVDEIVNNFDLHLKKQIEKQTSTEKVLCDDGNYYERVPSTTYWLVDNGEFIGYFSLRHRLTPFLITNGGGNIGYSIRPSKRRKGYATKGLSLVLEEAKKLGLDRVMISAKEENLGSWKAIEKNGGNLYVTEAMPWDLEGPKFKKYWINL